MLVFGRMFITSLVKIPCSRVYIHLLGSLQTLPNLAAQQLHPSQLWPSCLPTLTVEYSCMLHSSCETHFVACALVGCSSIQLCIICRFMWRLLATCVPVTSRFPHLLLANLLLNRCRHACRSIKSHIPVNIAPSIRSLVDHSFVQSMVASGSLTRALHT